MFLWWWNACEVSLLKLDLRIKKYVSRLHGFTGLLDIKNGISGWKFLWKKPVCFEETKISQINC